MNVTEIEDIHMENTAIIGVDLAKRTFQLHGARSDGSVAFRKKLTREGFLAFLAEQPACIVAMEACATAHGWGREVLKLGPEVRLVPTQYVKPYVKRQKNDMADAEAISEAASRPTMRFVAVKSEASQARAMLFRSRQMFVRQRTQTINALRGHLAEHGVVAPRSRIGVKRLAAVLEDDDVRLPDIVRDTARIYLEQIEALDGRIRDMDDRLRALARTSDTARRLQTMPGVGPMTALAFEAFAPDMSCFRRGRDFSAWLGLVPKQHSTGGKERLGRVSKRGQKDIRGLLIVGAMSVIQAATRFGIPQGAWLTRMLARKPRMVVAIALANKMARAIWAMLSKEEDYRKPAAA